jgi:membrane protein
VVGRITGYLIAVALDVGLFIVAFRLLTDREVATRDVLPGALLSGALLSGALLSGALLSGALLSGIVFWLLQQLSSLIIFRYLHNAERIYGSFATVITMLWWLYL